MTKDKPSPGPATAVSTVITRISSVLRFFLKHNFSADRQLATAFGYLKPCSKILDVGCGTGAFLKLAPHKIIGLDTNLATLKACRSQGLTVRFGSATKLPFPSRSFAGVHSSHVIEHLSPRQVYQFLAEATRVLKPGGILVIQAPLLWPGFYDNLTHVRPYPPRSLLRYLTEVAPDTTFPRLKSRYQLIALRWRYRWQWPWPIKTGYTLAVKKLI